MIDIDRKRRLDLAAAVLRVGLGLVFVIGGWSKLSQLLGSTEANTAIVTQYMGGLGYINLPFQHYLFFEGSPLTPSAFLTSLSTFELLSGIAFLAGLFVRPLSLFYGFLLWTFVVSLPVNTVPGVELAIGTYTSPAIFVQIRDIALSGIMFVLFNLGPGAWSVDKRLFGHQISVPEWDHMGLLLRFSLGLIFIVAGFFGNFAHVTTFGMNQWILAAVGLGLIFGGSMTVRGCSMVVVAMMLWFMAHKLNFDKSLIANLNGFKREFALGATAGVLVWLGGGELFHFKDLLRRGRDYFRHAGKVAT
jgi:uncharacterized membrane protein YphA (DoxX/SURF4 family)